MRIVLQRVSLASVAIEGEVKSAIGRGYLILLGIESDDTSEDINWLCKKIAQLRIFNDADGKMNLDIKQVEGDVLVISQFTLFAQAKKGNRPSFIRAARPDIAIPLYEQFVQTLSQELGQTIYTGEFGADMKVSLLNDGPVTLIIDTKEKDF